MLSLLSWDELALFVYDAGQTSVSINNVPFENRRTDALQSHHCRLTRRCHGKSSTGRDCFPCTTVVMDRIPPPPKSLTVSSQLDLEAENARLEATANARQSNGGQTSNAQPAFGYGCNNRLDEELFKLRKEMAGLRQLDMSLLSQLNALRQSILDYKKILNGGDANGDSNGMSVIPPNRSNLEYDDDLTDDEGGESTSETSSH